jgi:hypothetical protein
MSKLLESGVKLDKDGVLTNEVSNKGSMSSVVWKSEIPGGLLSELPGTVSFGRRRPRRPWDARFLPSLCALSLAWLQHPVD